MTTAEARRALARELCEASGAVARCPEHGELLTMPMPDDAPHAVAARRWRVGDARLHAAFASLDELEGAIEEVLGAALDECPYCA